MSGNDLIRGAAHGGFGTAVDGTECVNLRDLPPFTTLLVHTANSVYRVVVTEGPDVHVQGGAFFLEATSAYLYATSIAGRCLEVDCIRVGLPVEIHAGERLIVTSPVRAITTVTPSVSVGT